MVVVASKEDKLEMEEEEPLLKVSGCGDGVVVVIAVISAFCVILHSSISYFLYHTLLSV